MQAQPRALLGHRVGPDRQDNVHGCIRNIG